MRRPERKPSVPVPSAVASCGKDDLWKQNFFGKICVAPCHHHFQGIVTEDAGINLRKRERGRGSGEKGMGEVGERVGPGSRWLQGCTASADDDERSGAQKKMVAG